MRLNRHSLYFPAVTLTVLTITLTVILAISTYRNLHREQTQMEVSIDRKGIALLRLLEAVLQSHGYGGSEGIAQVQQLVSTAAPNENIAYIFMFNQQGQILAHSNPKMVGKLIDGGIPEGSEILSFRKNDSAEHRPEIRSGFHPVPSEPALTHYLGIGLEMGTLERAHHEDRRHTMMMAAMLILLGSGSLFFYSCRAEFSPCPAHAQSDEKLYPLRRGEHGERLDFARF